MPPLIQVKDLQNLCFDGLSRKLFDLCSNSNISDANIHALVKYFKTYLPSQILVFICEKLTKLCEKCLNQDWMTNFYYGLCKGLLSNQLLLGNIELVGPLLKSYNGINIRELKLRGNCYSIKFLPQSYSEAESGSEEDNSNPFTTIYGFCETLSNLTTFKCSQMCDNQLLYVLHKKCPNLEEIYLELCSQVDNRGISYFCGCTTLQKNICSSHSSCNRKLKKIVLEYTLVSNTSGAMLLQSCPNLEIIDLVPDINIGEVFNILHGTNREKIESIEKRYSLKELHSYMVLDSSELDLITYTCPQLNDVTLRCLGTERTDKNLLANLLRVPLTKLNVLNCNMNALLWLLEQMGSTLTSLSIQHLIIAHPNLTFDRSHLQQLIRVCPNVTHFTLRLSATNVISPNVPYESFGKDLTFFTSLTNLKIEGAALTEADLTIFIKKCCQLKSLHLACHSLDVMDDTFVYDILSDGLLKELETLYLYRPMLTMAGLQRIISNCPKLHTVGPLSSWLISKKDRASLASDIKTNNWDINIDGSEIFSF